MLEDFPGQLVLVPVYFGFDLSDAVRADMRRLSQCQPRSCKQTCKY